ncbi:hypothetical protein [Pseudomonas xanthosomatis]|uniref:hypothetical protein n=1 Tax=Pseudomonas xanthosomatis TaxID=2842356 RepID=UPI0035110229
MPTEARKISSSEAEYAKRVQGELRNDFTADKSKIRLCVDSKNLSSFEIVEGHPSGLISYPNFCDLMKIPREWVKIVGLSALYDLNALSDDELQRLISDTNSSTENTWYLHFGPVKPELISAVDFKIGKDYVSYDFDRHGRQAMSDLGFECISGDAHQRLLEFLKPGHHHDFVHSAIVCADPLGFKMATIRGLCNSCYVDIEKAEIVGLHRDDPNYPRRDVQEWIMQNIDELNRCWVAAVERFYKFFPEKRPK